MARRLDDFADDLRRLPDQIGDAVDAHLRDDEAAPLARAMKGRAVRMGRMAARASTTVRFTPTAHGGSVTSSSRGSSLGAVLQPGSEYGSRGRRWTRYSRRSKNGGAHVVRRRTTRQFDPWVGKTGYWYWPTVRKDMKGIVARTADVMDREVTRLG